MGAQRASWGANRIRTRRIQKVTGWSDAIVETTISRDLLLLTRVDKPALLRSLFRLVCDYSGQIVSYQKLTGQLQDAGNTTTLAHYLDLLATAGLATGLEKYAAGKVRQRRSTPKLLALDTALVSAPLGRTFSEARADREHWGNWSRRRSAPISLPHRIHEPRSSTGGTATKRSTSSSSGAIG